MDELRSEGDPFESLHDAEGSRSEEEFAILTQTLADHIGLFDFALGWDNDLGERIDITVHFRTPPEVALGATSTHR